MLTLTIEKKWFDMILSGEKTEEYRELKRYYDSRFRNAAMLKNQEYQASVSEFRNLAATVDQDIGTVRFRNGFDTGYRAAIDDMQDNLIRNSRTETIDGRTRLIVTEDTIETICREMRKRCK